MQPTEHPGVQHAMGLLTLLPQQLFSMQQAAQLGGQPVQLNVQVSPQSVLDSSKQNATSGEADWLTLPPLVKDRLLLKKRQFQAQLPRRIIYVGIDFQSCYSCKDCSCLLASPAPISYAYPS